jgi:hypothetical protein
MAVGAEQRRYTLYTTRTSLCVSLVAFWGIPNWKNSTDSRWLTAHQIKLLAIRTAGHRNVMRTRPFCRIATLFDDILITRMLILFVELCILSTIVYALLAVYFHQSIPPEN